MTVAIPLRSDAGRLRAMNRELRPPDRLRAHYEIERELAARLRASRQEERGALYGEVYTELFARLPDHPQHKADPEKRRRNTAIQVAFLCTLLPPAAVFVEVGCGDAAVTHSIAAHVQEAVGIDVTGTLIDHAAAPINFRFVRTDGTNLPLADGMADLVYSNQLMEHLHPDDARQQLQEVIRVLRPSGRYVCSTPNRLTGPHDISCYFDHEPQGLHLREYDHASLAQMFQDAGFQSARAVVAVKGRRMILPVGPVSLVERLLAGLPRNMQMRLTSLGPVRNMAGVILIGQK